jgi:hypothetical protein
MVTRRKRAFRIRRAVRHSNVRVLTARGLKLRDYRPERPRYPHQFPPNQEHNHGKHNSADNDKKATESGPRFQLRHVAPPFCGDGSIAQP